MCNDSLFQLAQQAPFLSPDQEQSLFENLTKESIETLVSSHLRLVISIARKYSHSMDHDDLIQVGSIGLLQAIHQFDSSKGVRFATFATPYIRGEILNALVENFRPVRIVTKKSHRKLFFNLRKFHQGRPFTEDELHSFASELDVDVEDVREMEQRMFGVDVSIDDEHDNLFDESNPEEMVIQVQESKKIENVASMISSLDERSQDILQHRLLSETKKPFREMAEKHGVSIERVRQIEQRAIQQVRAMVA